MFLNKLKKLLQENESQGSLLKDLSVSKNQGKVLSVIDGVVTISGLYNIYIGKILKFFSGIKGMVLSLEENSVRAVLFGNKEEVLEGDSVSSSTKSIMSFILFIIFGIMFIFLGFFLEFPTVDCAWGLKSSSMGETAAKYFNSFLKPLTTSTTPTTDRMFTNMTVRLLSSSGSTIDLLGSNSNIITTDSSLSTSYTSNLSSNTRHLSYTSSVVNPTAIHKYLGNELVNPSGVIKNYDADLSVKVKKGYALKSSRVVSSISPRIYGYSGLGNSLSGVPYISSNEVSQVAKLLKKIAFDNNIPQYYKNDLIIKIDSLRDEMFDFHKNFASLVWNNSQKLSTDFCINYLSQTSLAEKSMIYFMQLIPINFYDPLVDFTKTIELNHSSLKYQMMQLSADLIKSNNILYFYVCGEDFIKVVNETAHAYSLMNGEFYKVKDSFTGINNIFFRPPGSSLNGHLAVKAKSLTFGDSLVSPGQSLSKVDLMVEDDSGFGTPAQLVILSNPEPYGIALKSTQKSMKDFVNFNDNLYVTLDKDASKIKHHDNFSNISNYNRGIVLAGHLNKKLESLNCLLNNRSLSIYPLDIEKISINPADALETKLTDLQSEYLLESSQKFLSIKSSLKNPPKIAF